MQLEVVRACLQVGSILRDVCRHSATPIAIGCLRMSPLMQHLFCSFWICLTQMITLNKAVRLIYRCECLCFNNVFRIYEALGAAEVCYSPAMPGTFSMQAAEAMVNALQTGLVQILVYNCCDQFTNVIMDVHVITDMY